MTTAIELVVSVLGTAVYLLPGTAAVTLFTAWCFIYRPPVSAAAVRSVRQGASVAIFGPATILVVGRVFPETERIAVRTPAADVISAVIMAQFVFALVAMWRSKGFRWPTAAVQTALLWVSVCVYLPAYCSVRNVCL